LAFLSIPKFAKRHKVAPMNAFLRTLIAAWSITAASVAGVTLAAAADLGFLGGLFGADRPPPGPPLELAAPAPQACMYVPVSPPGMITYPGYTATYPNTACRGAYWARKPIFNADGLLVGYSRPQYMCPQWY
jgi:hypothetical protein